jgi:CheY-like chemotaxis protein
MKLKFLVVDNLPINLEFFNLLLSKLGFEVETAGDGEEALQKVIEFVPDIIILENIIPKLSGFEVTRILKKTEEYKDYRNIPILICLSPYYLDDGIEDIAGEIEGVITKPFSFREVIARIRKVLQRLM